jgi:L-2-hydroxyglutarate oxidase LhgO
MESYSIDAVVAGAGVVGLAIARRLTLVGLDVIVVERGTQIGAETSSRNSEVIHAGLYYPAGSVKARTCVAGNRLLYGYCESRSVEARSCGKLVVATSDDQLTELQRLWDQARANEVEELSWLTRGQVRRLEPEVTCVGAFLSRSTGIVDSHSYMHALLGDIESAGGVIAFDSPVVSAAISRERIGLVIGIFINATGHAAPGIASSIENFPAEYVPRQWYAKGNYFSLLGKQPFSRLVYPIPETSGLGVHATLDLQGRCRFGPDVEWVESDEDVIVDPGRAETFYSAIRTFWPGLPDGALQPDYAGIRPKLHGPTAAATDFRIDGPETHHVAGLVNLFGIESPGLTASLAIAELVASKLDLN